MNTIWIILCTLAIDSKYGLPGVLCVYFCNNLAFARHELLHILCARFTNLHIDSIWTNIKNVYGSTENSSLSTIKTILNIGLGRLQSCPTYLLPMDYERNIRTWGKFAFLKLVPPTVDLTCFLLGFWSINNASTIHSILLEFTGITLDRNTIIFCGGLIFVSSARLLPNWLPFPGLDGHILCSGIKKVIWGEQVTLSGGQANIFALTYLILYTLSITHWLNALAL